MNASGIDAGINIGNIDDDVAIITFGLTIPHDDDSVVRDASLIIVLK